MQSIFSALVVGLFCWFLVSGRRADSQPLRQVSLRTLAGLSFLLSLSSASLVAVAADTDPPSWESLKAHLKDRQDRFDCVTIEFEEVVNRLNDPQNPIKAKSEWKLQLKGDERVRVEEKGDIEPKINMAGDRVTFGERVSVTNGRVHASLMPNFGGEYTAGFVDVKDETHLCQHVSLMPLAVCFRPIQWLQRSDAPIKQSNGVTVDHALLGGTDCIVATWPDRNYIKSTWFDPTRNYAPMQVSIVKPSAKKEFRWRIEYKDASRPDIPTNWRFAALLENGIAREGRSAKLISYRSDAIPDTAFSIHFPMHAYIIDHVLQKNYIILEGGRAREVKDEEWQPGKTYDDILRRSPNRQQPTTHSQALRFESFFPKSREVGRFNLAAADEAATRIQSLCGDIIAADLER